MHRYPCRFPGDRITAAAKDINTSNKSGTAAAIQILPIALALNFL